MTQIRKIDFTSENKDIFKNLQVVTPSNIIDFKHVDSLNPNIIYQLLANGGAATLDRDKASAVLDVPAVAGAKVCRATRALNYQSGKAFRITFAATPFVSTIPNGIKWEAGYFDTAADKDLVTYPNQYPYGNGLFFRFLSGWSFINRSSITGGEIDSTSMDQASWNGDKLDGSGPSEVVLDPTKLNIFWIEFGWLSTLGFRFGIYEKGIEDEAHKIIAHSEVKTNILDVPFMQTGSLPITYRVENIAGTESAQSRMVCATAESLGGYDPTGVECAIDSGIVPFAIGAGATGVILAYRLKEEFNKRSLEILKNVIICTTNGNARIKILVNPIITNSPTWTDIGSGSGSEYSTDITVNELTGRSPNIDWVSNNSDRVSMKPDSIFVPSSDIEGKSDLMVIMATSIGANESYLGSSVFKEII